jgi:hypothetical protein
MPAIPEGILNQLKGILRVFPKNAHDAAPGEHAGHAPLFGASLWTGLLVLFCFAWLFGVVLVRYAFELPGNE